MTVGLIRSDVASNLTGQNDELDQLRHESVGKDKALQTLRGHRSYKERHKVAKNGRLRQTLQSLKPELNIGGVALYYTLTSLQKNLQHLLQIIW